MKVLVTGATSMIGVALSKELLKKNQVVAVVRKKSSKTARLPQSPNLQIVECEMQDYNHIAAGISGKVDVAVSLAWKGTRGESRNDIVLQESNYRYNIQLLEQLRKLGCRKIITAGSQAEYGLWYRKEKLDESVVPNPNTEYGKYKLKFYEDAKMYCEENKIKLIESRFFSLYGPNDFEGTLVISMLKKMLANQPCNLTECKQLWDFLYIDDAIDGLVKLIENHCEAGIYNFGSGESKSLKYYVEKMYQVAGSHSQLNYGVVPYPVTGMVNVNPSVEKLKGIGWKSQTFFEDGLRQIIGELRDD